MRFLALEHLPWQDLEQRVAGDVAPGLQVVGEQQLGVGEKTVAVLQLVVGQGRLAPH